jgi:hypothetical protein
MRSEASAATAAQGVLAGWGEVALAGAIACLYLLGGLFVAAHVHNRLDPSGAPLFYDFSAFYQAARFAASGHAASAYHDGAMIAAEQAAFPGTTVRLPWNYPPTFQLLLTPLAWLPYTAAWRVWTAAGAAAYALLARGLVEPRRLWVLLLAPAAALNVLVGQNGLFSVALLAGGALLIERRPILGGALIGLMAYKPHFAVLAPLALISGREWRAFIAAGASACALALASIAVFGLDPWIGFLHKAAQPAALFGSSSSAWRTIPSVLILGRSLGLGDTASAALHWTVAASGAVVVVWVWRSTRDARLRAAALAAATALFTPYLRIYDLALLTAPIAVLLQAEPGRTGHGDRVAVAAAWLAPAMLLFLPLGYQLGPLASLAVLVLIALRTRRRVRHEHQARAVRGAAGPPSGEVLHPA